MNEASLTPEERDKALEAIAGQIRRYGLETPAAFFLELHRPLAGFAGVAAHAVTPLFGAFFGLDNAEKYATLIGDGESIDGLLERLHGDAEPEGTGSTERLDACDGPSDPGSGERDKVT